MSYWLGPPSIHSRIIRLPLFCSSLARARACRATTASSRRPRRMALSVFKNPRRLVTPSPVVAAEIKVRSMESNPLIAGRLAGLRGCLFLAPIFHRYPTHAVIGNYFVAAFEFYGGTTIGGTAISSAVIASEQGGPLSPAFRLPLA